MKTPPIWPGARATTARIAAFVGAYLLAAVLARLSQAGPQGLTAVRPASGLVLAVLALSARRRWPTWLAAVWLCNLAQGLLTGEPWPVTVAYATTDVVEGALAASLLVAAVGTPVTLARLREVLALVGVAVLGSNALTALLGAAITAAWLGTPFWRAWFCWLISTGVGMLLVAPLILAWQDGLSRLRAERRHHALEALGLLASLAVAGVFVFHGAGLTGFREGSLPYLTFPWLMWAALRTGPFFATLASAVIASLAVGYTVHGAGPFAAAAFTVQGQVLSAQAFVSIAVLSSLLPAAVVAERRRAQEGLERSNRLYAVLSATSQAVVRLGDPADLLAEVCRIATGTGVFKLAWIGRLEGDGGALHVVAAEGPGSAYLDAPSFPIDVPARRGPTGTAVRENRLVVFNDLQAVVTDGAWRGEALSAGLRAVACVPLCVHGRVRGVFALYTAEPGFFDRAEVQLLEELGASISFGLEAVEREELRIAAEDASANAYRRFRAIFEHANDAIILLDRHRVVDCNPRAEALFGLTRPGLLDAAPAALAPAEQADGRSSGEAFDDRVRTALAGEAQYFAWTVLRADGTTVDVEVGLSAVELDGRPMLVAMVRDITDRQRLEGELREAQKMEAVGRLAGGIAHDFNNLLQVITGFAGLALEGLPRTDPSYEPFREIAGAAHRATELTGRLLTFSRKQPTAPILLDLNAAIADMESMLRRLIGEDIEIHTVPAAGLGRVRVDPNLVSQVLLNLAANARDAMPHGGALTVRTVSADIGESDARKHVELTPGRYAVIIVSDTGAGMSDEVQARIFEPFFTTKPRGKGTGLGLSTVYGVVRQSGGHVRCTSKVGVGTTFEIYLPTVQEALEGGELAEGGDLRYRGSETILLVEDEGQVRRLARQILERFGYHVLEAASGQQAVAIAGSYPAPIHLLLTDVIMPGMAGPQVAAQVRTVRADAKVLFMSGYTDDALVSHGMLDQRSVVLQKPFSPAALGARVREVLES